MRQRTRSCAVCNARAQASGPWIDAAGALTEDEVRHIRQSLNVTLDWQPANPRITSSITGLRGDPAVYILAQKDEKTHKWVIRKVGETHNLASRISRTGVLPMRYRGITEQADIGGVPYRRLLGGPGLPWHPTHSIFWAYLTGADWRGPRGAPKSRRVALEKLIVRALHRCKRTPTHHQDIVPVTIHPGVILTINNILPRQLCKAPTPLPARRPADYETPIGPSYRPSLQGGRWD